MSSSVTMKKRKPCAKGTRWVPKAEKCMTADENRAYRLAVAEEKVANLRKPLVPISYQVTPPSPSPPQEEKVEVDVEVPEKKTEKVEVEVEEVPDKTKPASILDSITSVFQPAAEEKEKLDEASPIAEEKTEEKTESPIVEDKKEEEIQIPENILLKENEKICPKGYYRHPSRSRNCTRKKKSSNSFSTSRKKRGNTKCRRGREKG